MTLLLLLVLLLLLALTLLNGDWRTGLLISLAIGFAQDPIRKLTPGQPGLFVGLALIAFTASAFCLFNQRRGRLEFPLMFRARPALIGLVGQFAVLIAFGAGNGFLRWGNPLRTGIGIGFYLAPLAGLWLGFQLGRDQLFLRRFVQTYLFFSFLFAITVLLDYSGIDIPVFKEVGGGIRIDIMPGLSVFGASGLWRSSELAAWHLAASSCLSLSFAASQPASGARWTYLGYSVAAGLLTIVTGRRKAIVQIVVFLAIYLWMSSRPGAPLSRERVLAILLAVAGLAGLVALIGPSELLGDKFTSFALRASTATSELGSRFNRQGIDAFWRGLSISDGLGVGVGTLAQTGAAGISQVSAGAAGSDFVYVSESGLGKIVAELGIPGLIIVPPLLFQLVRAVWINLQLLARSTPAIQTFETGLVAFAASNVLFFSAAAGVYGDPMVLILCGICLGSVFAAPLLVAQRVSSSS